MMEKLTEFQSSTQNELHYLRNRVKHLEDFIQKAYHPPKSGPGSGLSYPPPQYAYMSPYQPFTQPPVHVQYANYVPPHYSTQGGPPVNQAYMSRSGGVPNRPQSNKASKERNTGYGDKMEQENPYSKGLEDIFS